MLRIGTAEVDLDPPPGLPMAGHGLAGRVARGPSAPLLARALALEDEAVGRLTLVVVDLMSGTRAVWQAAAERLGVGPERLVLLGTHTHHGPGGIYGSSLYDALASARPGHDRRLVARLAERVAEAARRAGARLVPARVGLGRATLFGTFQNAALPAFRRNPEAASWNEAGRPGAGAPPGAAEALRAVDPRLDALTFTGAGGRPLAVLAVARGHATALSRDHDGYAPDWPGEAARRAGQALGAWVAVAAGAGGDENPLGVGLAQGPALVAAVGERVAEGLVRAAERGAAVAREARLSFALADLPLRQASTVDGDAATTLARSWVFGAPALGGAEDGRSPLHTLGLARGGMLGRDFPRGHPQRPKRRALGPLQGVIARWLRLAAPTSLPVHLVRVGEHALATVPGEPTATLGWRIEQAVARAAGAATATTLGYAADYAGYFTTPEEYDAQEYEGASMLLGRNVGAHLTARLVSLARDPIPAPRSPRTRGAR